MKDIRVYDMILFLISQLPEDEIDELEAYLATRKKDNFESRGVADYVEYKNIEARYFPGEKKATFILNTVPEKKIKLSRRYFFVFKCLVINAGKCVTGRNLEIYVANQGEHINERAHGLGTYVARLKKELNLGQFFVMSGEYSKGWMLKDPFI